jgi:hypothetical protein
MALIIGAWLSRIVMVAKLSSVFCQQLRVYLTKCLGIRLIWIRISTLMRDRVDELAQKFITDHYPITGAKPAATTTNTFCTIASDVRFSGFLLHYTAAPNMPQLMTRAVVSTISCETEELVSSLNHSSRR